MFVVLISECLPVRNQEKEDIERTIDSKRVILYALFDVIGDFTHPAIVQLSQDIDDYIVQLQRIKKSANQTDQRNIKEVCQIGKNIYYKHDSMDQIYFGTK